MHRHGIGPGSGAPQLVLLRQYGLLGRFRGGGWEIIIAQGKAYVEFAIELARQMDLCQDPQVYEEATQWFKNIC